MSKLCVDEPSRGRNTNSVVEDQTESTVGRITTFVGEQVVYNVVDDREQRAARLVHGNVFAIGTQSALGPGSWK